MNYFLRDFIVNPYLLSLPGWDCISSSLKRLANNINAFIGLLGLSQSWLFLVGVVGGDNKWGDWGSSGGGKLNL